MADTDDATLRAVWLKCIEADEDFHDDFDDFKNVVRLADQTSSALRVTEAKRGAAAWFQAHVQEEQAKKQRMRESMEKEAVKVAVPRRGTAARVRWPTKMERGLAAAGDVSGMREKIEKVERERWLRALHAQIMQAELPVSKRRGPNDSIPLNRVGKGRRPATLRKHVKTWGKVASWLKVVYGRCWPSRPEEFADFLEGSSGRTMCTDLPCIVLQDPHVLRVRR